MYLNKLIATAGIVFSLTIVAFGQGQPKQPVKPIRQFVVTPAQSLADLQKKVQPSNKVEELIGGAGMELRVAIQHEKDTTAANAEVHDQSDDVYYVLEGSGSVLLDGVENPVSKGSLVHIPPGVVHGALGPDAGSRRRCPGHRR